MDSHLGNSQDTLRRVEQNDAQFTELLIGYVNNDGGFTSSDASDSSRLGTAIGNNTHLTNLVVNLRANQALDIRQIMSSLMDSNEIHLSVTLNLIVTSKFSLEE